MNDIAPIVIEMQKLLRQLYEQFNERQFEQAKETAVVLKSASEDLLNQMK